MTGRKTQISLLLIALASCFMITAQAATVCFICLYNQDANAAYDPSQGACLFVPISGNGGGGSLDAPFVGDENEFTVDSFRYVGLSDCDVCTLTVPNPNGMDTVIDGSVSYSSLNFDAYSFDLECGPDTVFEEEEQEEVIEECEEARRVL